MLKVNSASSRRLVILQLNMTADAAVASGQSAGWTAGGSNIFLSSEESSDLHSKTKRDLVTTFTCVYNNVLSLTL
jgi:hypothetical protein